MKAHALMTLAAGSINQNLTNPFLPNPNKQELCHAAAHFLLHQAPASTTALLPAAERARALTAAAGAVQTHLAKFPARYCLSVEAVDVVAHMALLAEAARTGAPAVLVTPAALGEEKEGEGAEGGGEGKGDESGGSRRWVVTVSSRDRPHLLDALTRTLSCHATQIVDADAMTGVDGMALDRFVVESRESLVGRSRAIAASVEEQLRRGGTGEGRGRGGQRGAESFLAGVGGGNGEGEASSHAVVMAAGPSSSLSSLGPDGSQPQQQPQQPHPRRPLRRRLGAEGMVAAAAAVARGVDGRLEEEEEDNDDISMQLTPPYPVFHGKGEGPDAMIPFEEIELLEGM